MLSVKSYVLWIAALLLTSSSLHFAASQSAVDQPLLRKGNASDHPTLSVHRDATAAAGGMPGYVNFAGRFETSTGKLERSFEWALLGQVRNNSIAGENVGVYGQGLKLSSGTTWGGVSEAIEKSDAPYGSLVAHEFDLVASGSGSDRGGSRVALDIYGKRPTSNDHMGLGFTAIRVNSRVDDFQFRHALLGSLAWTDTAVKMTNLLPLPAAQGAQTGLMEFHFSDGNDDTFRISAARKRRGTSWQSVGIEMQRIVDGQVVGSVAFPEAGGVLFDDLMLTQKTPRRSRDVCKAGQIGIDTEFIYVCTAKDHWKRAKLGDDNW